MTLILDHCKSMSRRCGPRSARMRPRDTRPTSRVDRRPAAVAGPAARRDIVETALVLNVCLMFLLGLLDFSRVIMMRQLVINAAREGCRYAVVSTSTVTTSQVQTYVTNYLCGQQINSLTINVYEADPDDRRQPRRLDQCRPVELDRRADYRNDQHDDAHLQHAAQQLAGPGDVHHGQRSELKTAFEKRIEPASRLSHAQDDPSFVAVARSCRYLL